jgi:phospholipase C
MTRRRFLGSAAATTGAAALASWFAPVLERAWATDPAGCGTLGDIDHFVFLMQENRSFDHYFGTLSGVRGFSDPAARAGAFDQVGYSPGIGPTSTGFLEPFRLQTTSATLDGECVNDPTHDWGPQHDCWDGGRMDGFVRTHVASEGAGNGPVIMGYYTRADLPLHHALADAFTVCDGYHCSVLGPTYPNRLYWMSGTIDPDGKAGGPLVETLDPVIELSYYGKFGWKTMPEVLQEAGVSWKVYQSPDTIEAVETSVFIDNVLRYFAAYTDPATPLHLNALVPTYPGTFELDVATGQLPQVSWIITTFAECEHPAAPPAFGAYAIADVLQTLVSNPSVWEKTALIVSYDENGGFFDHVPPPVPPLGTPGEFLTVDLANVPDAAGVAGPIGLGFRVPCLVISPYSRGGLVSSDIFDHTSQLRLLESRFGVDVPNLSAWRRATVGDMTATFDFASPPSAGLPPLPATSLVDPIVLAQCDGGADAVTGSLSGGQPYPVPPNAMPTQETTPTRGRPSGVVAACAPAVVTSAPPSSQPAIGATSAPAPIPAAPIPAAGTGGSLPVTGEPPGLALAGLGAASAALAAAVLRRRTGDTD